MRQLDSQLFYWINQHYCTPLDWVMWCASQDWCWAIVLLTVFVFGTLRYEPKKWWVVLIGIALCFLITDRVSVLCFKNVFCRLRPCHALEGVRMFRTSCGGQYGFVSSHAANVGAVAIFLIIRIRKASETYLSEHRNGRPRWTFSASAVTVLLMLWALVVCYSRPYLGKHYPGDVICGALLGLIIGGAIFYSIYLIENKHVSKKVQ